MNFASNPQSCYSAGPSDGRATARDHQRRDECRWKDRAPGRQRRSIEQRRRSPPRASPRAAVDAILVGVGTVLKDDPKLTVKSEYAKGRNPLRVVLDSDGKIPDSAHVLDGSAPTLIVTSEVSDRSFPGAEVMRLGKDEVDLQALLDRLAARDVKTILVEGGSTVIWCFLRKGLADELKVFVSSRV